MTAVKLIRASKYSVEELTAFYNQTRVDYMVPMPMNVARLQEYIHVYDLDLKQSLVATYEDEVVGLCMLGVRENRTWITRLGVIPTQRRVGAGRALMHGMIANTKRLGLPKIQLEVIAGNKPAHRLFTGFGFRPCRELLILRHAPSEVRKPKSTIEWLAQETALELLKTRRDAQAWTNQTESMLNVKGLAAFKIDLPGKGQAWMAFQRTMFNLTRLMYETDDNAHQLELTCELLCHLHNEYPLLDTYTENISVDDPRVASFKDIGYIEAFRRVEMENIL